MSHVYTPEERDFIKNFAFGHSYKQIIEAINNKFGVELTQKQIGSYLKRHKIKTGRTGHFQKGCVPANKGTHIGGYEPTQFKKGQLPTGTKPVGTETVRKDGYIWVKVEMPNVWKQKHLLIWEKANGKVPKGHVIIFLDGNRGNTSLDNLFLIDRKTEVAMNRLRLQKTDKETTTAILNLARLQIKMAEAKKGRKNDNKRN